MPGYVPHTPADQQAMLERIGLSSLEDLFASIPEALKDAIRAKTLRSMLLQIAQQG